MPEVWEKVKFRGMEDEIEIETLMNSGARVTVLTPEIVERIKPKEIGKRRIRVATEEEVLAPLYLVEIEIKDSKGNIRKCETEAIMLKRSSPILGIPAMESLRIIPDILSGRVRFEEIEKRF